MGKGKSLCIKLRKFFEKEKDYFVAETARCNKVDFGYKCNIAGGADIDKSAIGSRTSIGRYTTVRNCNIGKYCSISWNCSLGAKNHPYAHASGNAAFFNLDLDLWIQIKRKLQGKL